VKKWRPILLSLVALMLVALAAVALFFNRPREAQYCWLVFGSEGSLRVLVERTAKSIAIDGNADGRFSAAERFKSLQDCQNFVIADPDDRSRYVITSVNEYRDEDSAVARLMFSIDIEGPVAYQQYCDVGMHGRAETASRAHFHGPLSIDVRRIWGKLPKGLVLTRGEEPSELQVNIGTFDVAKDCWVVVRTHDDEGESAFPEGVHPFADVEFPAQTAGDPPIVERYPLDQFC
jgi:hypothetical protein